MTQKTYEKPSINVTKLEVVHNAKSWNPGKGKDTTDKGGKKKK